MSETMKGVVCYGPGDYRLENNIPKPKIGPGEILVKVKSCGICAGDVKACSGAPMFWGNGNLEDSWVKTPVIPGHEYWGVVEALGEGAAELHNVEIGDYVVSEQIVPCRKCRFCRSGKYWMCEVHNIRGFQKDVADGGMAEYMKFYAHDYVHKIPKTLSFEDAALLEPMACAIHVVRRAKIDWADVVVLAGAGPLGLCMAQLVPLLTPKKFIVIDMDNERLKLAKQFGADLTLNPATDNVQKIVKDLTGGYGCDVYIEATGNPKAVTQGLEMIRKLGRFVEFSVFSHETTVDWSVIGDRKELDIMGAHLGPYAYDVAIDLFDRGLVTSKGIITHQYSLDDYEDAFKMAEKLESIKVLLNP
ncbi:alcohol dehydrogenase catalytic domain-containing protein [Pasteurella skyensis]|uniref:Alcohol dehydrogenase catalytic domain-containing protein n=1 Tax=Phocoenobacter skyensis TaxID=97481 RepID=A0AAJ6N7U6_9PAST|nr:alcohol dehydrogenase catalytic domain-containing protein [Pasteurella skyensis]MDP8161649.1 alcohol dehydrogenase catalytic domain-containing protein [Pasteurella skyensis]MDP8171805.1 alcohol dehydrogenase catalytic domain-containing protein [Pasteurella skyensis]MDP8176043.1 alcohol dehydrogenase catalytic domain-containing protein [Pasteurella skyensis]MDP8178011.1 alcohol dehydrogenase catalytic domain-containing protein [Pasteurella skyensis]MDP8182330.1 alcohol dehydrogenase catalyti